MHTKTDNRAGSAAQVLTNPLDLPIQVTDFRSIAATKRLPAVTTLRKWGSSLNEQVAPAKKGLPLRVLGCFGEEQSPRGCYRTDRNLIAFSGILADYDGGEVTVEKAAAMLRKARIGGMFYESPSSEPGNERWRFTTALSREHAGEDHAGLLARVNGALGGILEEESALVSRSYYFGKVEGTPDRKVELVEGRFLDEADDLDAGAIPIKAKAFTRHKGEARDPGDTLDIRGAFNRLYDVHTAIAEFELPYEGGGDSDRYLHIGAHGSPAARVYDDGQWFYSDHAQSDPAYGMSLDAYNLVRIHKFGHLDTDAPAETGLPSYAAMDKMLARFREVQAEHRAAVEEAFDELPDDPEAGDDGAMGETRLLLLSPDQCANAPSRGYVLKGMLAPGDVGCFYSMPGVGKSLLAPHVGYMIAQGERAFDMRTRKGGVLYVAAEDPLGMQGRITALWTAHGEAEGFHLIPNVSDLATKNGPDLKALRREVANRKPALIIIDTLAMAFPGIDENTGEGMGRVVAVCRKLTEHGAAVLLLHHTTQADGPNPRGHSVLNGALDMALKLEKSEGGIVRGKLKKNRNGSSERELAFRIAVRNIGTDEDGDPITAALVKELPPLDEPKAAKLTKGEERALSVLVELIGERTDGVLVADWKKVGSELGKVSSTGSYKRRHEAMSRAVQGLVDKKRIRIVLCGYGKAGIRKASAKDGGDERVFLGGQAPEVFEDLTGAA